jgi:hypothetical protein
LKLIAPEKTEPKRQKIDVITILSSDEEEDEEDSDDTIKETSIVPSSTPVLSSGSGSDSGTPNHIQSLPSPDSSSSASSLLQQIHSKSNTPTSYYSNVNTSLPLNSTSTVSSTTYNNR